MSARFPLFSLGSCSLSLLASLAAQDPVYHMTAAVRTGEHAQTALQGPPGQPFASLLDVGGGPVPLFGGVVRLDLSPSLTLLEAGQLDAAGLRLSGYLLPHDPALVGRAFYTQSIVVDASLPQPLRLSNGESAGIHRAARALVLRFDDPAAEGYVGTYDTTIRGRLASGPRRVRTQTLRDPFGVPHSAPFIGPFHPLGARLQSVYRAVDLGATGEPERIVALRWHPIGQVANDLFDRLRIEISHTAVTPDFRVDPLSALPRFPQSGLDLTFANNPSVPSPVAWYDGPYRIDPLTQRPDGYVPFPAPQFEFPYDGVSSVLIDFKTPVAPSATGGNGMAINLMVQSAAEPFASVSDISRSGVPVDPFTTTLAREGGNYMPWLQVDFERVSTYALSPFVSVQPGPFTRFDWQAPILASSPSNHPGIRIEYRGAVDAAGTGATAWSTNVDVADSLPWVQLRITMAGDQSLDTIVIPVE